MNLGQLVRQKMKELNADLSGEYIDKVGRHFEMSVEGEGYAVTYGGGQKKIAVEREVAARLTSHCRKLEAPSPAKQNDVWNTTDLATGNEDDV